MNREDPGLVTMVAHDRAREMALSWAADEELTREFEAPGSSGSCATEIARVRVRLANEPAPSAWWVRWAPLGAALAAISVAAGVTVAILPGPDHNGRPGTGDRTVIPARTVATAFAPAPTGSARHPMASPSRVPAGPGSRFSTPGARLTTHDSLLTTHHSRLPGPEVLVSRAESAALWRTVQSAREGHIVVPSGMSTGSDIGADLQPPPDIEIAPITVEPIVVQAGGETKSTEGVQP